MRWEEDDCCATMALQPVDVRFSEKGSPANPSIERLLVLLPSQTRESQRYRWHPAMNSTKKDLPPRLPAGLEDPFCMS
jgi:hypothetical protein